MGFLDRLWDIIKGTAPTVAGGLATGLTGGNPIIGGLVAKTVRGLIGKSDDNSALKEDEAMELINNPDLYMKFKLEMANLEMAAIKEDTKRLQMVNETMQAESKSESKAQRGWRPFNGFMFGITLFCDYFVSQIVTLLCQPTSFTWQHIPAGVYMLWTTVLGVTAGSRGFEKISQIKAQNGGNNMTAIDTIKTFGAGFIGK